MKPVVYFSIGLFLSCTGFAQQVNYTVLKDAPNYADLYWAVSLNTLVMEHGEADPNMFFGFETTLRYFPKNLPVNIFIRKSLPLQGSLQKANPPGGGNGIKKLGWFETIAGFALKKTVTYNTKVVLSSSRTYTGGGGHTDRTNFIKVPAKHIISFEFHTGFFSYRDFMKWGSEDIKAKDGTIINSGITNNYIRAIPLGISYLDKRKIIIDAKGKWGECRNARTAEGYFDILILSSLKIDDVLVTDNTVTTAHVLKDDSYNAFESKTFGWRAGMRFYPGSSFGWFLATELGAIPGTPVIPYSGISDQNRITKKLNRAYFTGTVGLSLQLLLEKLFKQHSKQKDESNRSQ